MDSPKLLHCGRHRNLTLCAVPLSLCDIQQSAKKSRINTLEKPVSRPILRMYPDNGHA